MSALKKIIRDLKTKNSISGLKKSDLHNLGLNATFFFDENNTIPDNEEWSCTVDNKFMNIEIKNKKFNLGKIELEFQKIEDTNDNKKIKSLFTKRWNEFVSELKYQSFFISYKADTVISLGVIENCPLDLTEEDVKNLLQIHYIDSGKITSMFDTNTFSLEKISVTSEEIGNRTKDFISKNYSYILIENFKSKLNQIISSEVEVIDESILLELFKKFKLEVKYIFDCKFLDIALYQINYRRDYSPINLSGSIKYIIRKINLNKIYSLKGRELRKVGITDNALNASQRYIITVEDNYYTIENEEGHTKLYNDLKYVYKEIDERENLVKKIKNLILEIDKSKNQKR